MYNVKSLKAEEFISDEEIKDVLNRLEPAVIKNGRHFHVISGSHAFKGT